MNNNNNKAQEEIKVSKVSPEISNNNNRVNKVFQRKLNLNTNR